MLARATKLTPVLWFLALGALMVNVAFSWIGPVFFVDLGTKLLFDGAILSAELAFVVINIAYVQHLILSTEAFYTLMVTAFILNILVPVTIAWWKPYYEDELQKEAERVTA